MTSRKLFEFDREFNSSLIIGTDEAGRGPGAGGVFASAVYFPNTDDKLIKQLACLNDSKKLSKKQREELYEIILENTINSTVCVEVEEIEKINLLNASLKAMGAAVENVVKEIGNRKGERANSRSGILARQQSRVGLLSHQHEANILLLIDGNKLIKTIQPFDHSTFQQKCIVKGDGKSASIAAASILAKVSRDRYMADLHEKFPHYNWVQNAGYLTREHLHAIDRYGLTPCHRKSFLRKHEEKCNTVQLNLYQK